MDDIVTTVIQANEGGPKENPGRSQIEPNWSRIWQSPAKEDQRKSLHFLRRIEPSQGLAPTPQGIFSFSSSGPADASESMRRSIVSRTIWRTRWGVSSSSQATSA
jgi:hypothetical protein